MKKYALAFFILLAMLKIIADYYQQTNLKEPFS